MKPKDLLSQLLQFEYSLNNLSLEKLNTVHALSLKKSFKIFRSAIVDKIYQLSEITAIDNSDAVAFQLNLTSKEVTTISAAYRDKQFVKINDEVVAVLKEIVAYVDSLKHDKLSEYQYEYIVGIKNASKSLIEVVYLIQDYTKQSLKNASVNFVDFNLENLLKNVENICTILLLNKPTKLKLSIDKTVPKVLQGNPSKLTEILLNILVNALKFMKHGSIGLHVSLEEVDLSSCVLKFNMVGIVAGISKSHLKLVFNDNEPYGNTNEVYDSISKLSIAKQIIESEGGRIDIANELEHETTFSFLLPYFLASKEATKRMGDKLTELKEHRSLKNANILVYEDDFMLQKIIQQQLASWQCYPHIVDDRLYAMHILENTKIDIVLLSANVPYLNSYEIVKRIRNHKNEQLRNTPIVVLINGVSIQNFEKGITYKINDCVSKPYVLDELKSILLKNLPQKNTVMALESKRINSEKDAFNDVKKINLVTILEDCLGQVDWLEELITSYKENALEFIGVMRVNIENEGMKEIALAAQKVKCGLAMMESENLHNIAEQIEKICKTDGDVKHLTFLFDCFVKEYVLVADAIEEQIQVLKKT